MQELSSVSETEVHHKIWETEISYKIGLFIVRDKGDFSVSKLHLGSWDCNSVLEHVFSRFTSLVLSVPETVKTKAPCGTGV